MSPQKPSEKNKISRILSKNKPLVQIKNDKNKSNRAIRRTDRTRRTSSPQMKIFEFRNFPPFVRAREKTKFKFEIDYLRFVVNGRSYKVWMWTTRLSPRRCSVLARCSTRST